MTPCVASLAGLTSMCPVALNGEGECCGAPETLHQRVLKMNAEDVKAGAAPSGASSTPGASAQAAESSKGDSGYIHPDAWLGARDIGTLTDPKSTGRKRVERMYRISAGQVCDWARKKNCGGGLVPVVGCLNNPATDLHHGPDKNTLNNAKMTRQVGDTENVHVICSECHNRWHAANDGLYPEYDRITQQAEPWLPVGEWSPHEPVEADTDELIEEERHREEQRRQRGREHRGRNATAREEGDFAIDPDE